MHIYACACTYPESAISIEADVTQGVWGLACPQLRSRGFVLMFEWHTIYR